MSNAPRKVLLTGVGLVVLLGACGATATTSTTTVASATTASAPPPSVGDTTGTAPASAAPQSPATTQGAEVVVAGDIPDNQAFVAYAPGVYTIKVPEGWARSTDGTAIVFTDKYNSIRIETVTATTAPTVASVTNGDLAIVAKMAKGYKAGNVSTVTRKAGSAILATYQMDARTSGVTAKTVRLDVERYEFWRNATAVVVTLSAATGSDNVDPWKTVTDGFGWTA
jgi:hypothetical protein